MGDDAMTPVELCEVVTWSAYAVAFAIGVVVGLVLDHWILPRAVDTWFRRVRRRNVQ